MPKPSPKTAALPQEPSPSSYIGKVLKFVNQIGQMNHETEIPDKSNTGKLLGSYYLYNELRKWAEGKADAAWERMVASGMVEDPSKLAPGEHGLATSTHFVLMCKVSNPVKRFNPDALAAELQRKYKIPKGISLEMIEKAKVPAKSTVTKSIAERA